MKDLIKQEFSKWVEKLIKSIKKDPIQKIAIIFILPFLIHAFAEVLIDFGLLTTIGYYVACVYGFSKILDDPYRIIKWGLDMQLVHLLHP